MLLDNLNLNQIRVFESVYRTRSMTRAAEELHMTQSGVSQHIKLMEELLEIKLFDRIKQKLVPTEKANLLYTTSSASLSNLEQALKDITSKERRLAGKITIGLPIEFGNNIILPKLAAFALANPKIQFQIFYGFASEMNQLLLSGELDFAIVDSFQLDPQIESRQIYQEKLVLCCSLNYLEQFKYKGHDKKFFESLQYIAYMKDQPLLRMWFKHHFNYHSISLNVRATLMDVQGVRQLIDQELGAGILPFHALKGNERAEGLYLFEQDSTPITNTISIAFVQAKTRSIAVEDLIQSLGF